MFGPLFNLSMLMTESAQVIGLRMLTLAGGGTRARDEAYLMVAEKVGEARLAVQEAMSGASFDSIVTGYRGVVHANAERLLSVALAG